MRFILGHSQRRNRKTVEQQLLEKINVTETCWLWTGAKDGRGYGRVRINGITQLAHRAVFDFCEGDVTGTELLHECDNPSCVRPHPWHVWPGDHRKNMRQAALRGQLARGQSHGMAKFTDADVVRMRVLSAGGATLASIAELFSTSTGHVSSIINRKLWTHI